ncbi:MAG: ABC transporter ATP-binding protein [Granulosicoccus sp.]
MTISHAAVSNEALKGIHEKAASVHFEQVSKVYNGSVTAVDNVSLRVEAGELVTLLGPSGCGKTTTLRMIAGLEMPSRGKILIGDRDVTKFPATDRDVSMVFQSYALFPHMSVMENVSYGLKISKFKKAEVLERAQEGLNLVGLSGYGDRLPSELSGGQQQRVAVARALVLEPQVLLFDEPLSNLDAKLRRQVRDDIRDIQTRLGLTVVYVTHDQEEALAVSDRIIVMNNAVIAQVGTPRELYDAPADAFVADFIGEANLLDAEVLDVVDGMAKVDLGAGQMQITTPVRESGVGAGRIAVRPGRVKLLSATEPNTLAGTIEKSTYVGSHMEYRVTTAVGNVFVVADVDTDFAIGESVGVGFMSKGPVLLSTS